MLVPQRKLTSSKKAFTSNWTQIDVGEDRVNLAIATLGKDSELNAALNDEAGAFIRFYVFADAFWVLDIEPEGARTFRFAKGDASVLTPGTYADLDAYAVCKISKLPDLLVLFKHKLDKKKTVKKEHSAASSSSVAPSSAASNASSDPPLTARGRTRKVRGSADVRMVPNTPEPEPEK